MRRTTLCGVIAFALCSFLGFCAPPPLAKGSTEFAEAATQEEIHSTEDRSSAKFLERVINAAKPAFREWIASISDERLAEYGFRARAETDRLEFLTPIVSLTPARAQADLTKEHIEATFDIAPSAWLVPVLVLDRIVSLVVVVDRPGDNPRERRLEAVEFGKSFAANRLNAGLVVLGTGPKDWRIPGYCSSLRYLSFVGPTVDLLVLRTNKGPNTWVRLQGTTEPKAAILESTQIAELLAGLVLPAGTVR